jgi:hypothetical protein
MTGEKKQLTLDTDWRTAAGALGITLFSILLGAGSAWAMFVGKRFDFQPSWQTAFVIIVFIWGMIVIPERMVRFALGLFLFQPLIEIIGWLFHFSPAAQVMNQSVARCTVIAACLIICIYEIQWFREVITYT